MSNEICAVLILRQRKHDFQLQMKQGKGKGI